MAFERCRTGGFWGWRTSHGPIGVYFGGKGPDLELEAIHGALDLVVPAGIETAWLQQVHSATVVDARPGRNGPGDALVTERRQLALAVVTADCVPVLLADDRRIAAVHAGWRGLAESILPAAVDRLNETSDPINAWIGPAIGPCCYEVSHEVAQKVGASSSEAIVRDGPRGRPHLDLAAAARIQLESRGEVRVNTVEACTRCDADRLWSYRRDGPGAGRNVAAIWRRPQNRRRRRGSQLW